MHELCMNYKKSTCICKNYANYAKLCKNYAMFPECINMHPLCKNCANYAKIIQNYANYSNIPCYITIEAMLLLLYTNGYIAIAIYVAI